METVKLYLCDVKELKDDYLIAIPFLTELDKENILKYKVEEQRKEKAISTYFKHKFIGEYQLNSFGKPITSGLFFNISHSHGLVGIVISDTHDIGIDIEKIRKMEDKVAKYISSDEEYKYIKDDKSFFEVWTNKESITKAYGSGIKGKISEIPALPLNGVKKFHDDSYFSHTMELNGYIISISRKSEDDFKVEISFIKTTEM